MCMIKRRLTHVTLVFIFTNGFQVVISLNMIHHIEKCKIVETGRHVVNCHGKIQTQWTKTKNNNNKNS